MKFEDGHRVVCPEHGSTGLTLEEYERQMFKPDSLWTCPICQQAGWWDDEAYEKWLDRFEQA